MTLWCTVAKLWCHKLCAVFLTTLYIAMMTQSLQERQKKTSRETSNDSFTERRTDKHKQTETDRQIDRQTDRQKHRQTIFIAVVSSAQKSHSQPINSRTRT